MSSRISYLTAIALLFKITAWEMISMSKQLVEIASNRIPCISDDDGSVNLRNIRILLLALLYVRNTVVTSLPSEKTTSSMAWHADAYMHACYWAVGTV